MIDRIVRQLTEESDVADRESLPAFSPEEFLPARAFHTNNAITTRELIEDLDYLPELREQAASLFNSAARPAVKAMSGLIGSGLRDVFDAIRKELRGDGKRLALFVEDVSVMASLDEDVLNAVEPNPDPELGQLVAVVGMTDTGFIRLPENLVGRTTEIVGVGMDTAAVWLAAPPELARFAARYLNVARMSEGGVRAVAADRLNGGDVAHSVCTLCLVREACHRTFGAVAFDGVDVGLFPFTERALHTLFGGLNERVPAVRKNPRGLLEHVLTPILRDDRAALLDRTFPRAKLPVELDEPEYWSAFTARYLGGWSASERSRLRTFAQGWIRASTEDQAADEMQQFLGPLGFQKLSSDPTPAQPGGEKPPLPPTPPPPPSGEPEALRILRNDMSRWADGQTLENDEVPRGLLLDLLKNAIAWDDEPVPVKVYDKLLKSKAHIRFEDQRSRLRAGQVVAFEVHRGDDERAMVEALARWKWEGGESWRFSGGQRHRRVTARWLRHNRPRIIEALLPPSKPGREPAIAHAVRALAVASMLRRGTDHPPDRPGIVRELLRVLPNELPPVFNAEDERALGQVWAAHSKAREFVLGELSAPQGGTRGGTVYIDPRPLLKYADSVHKAPVVNSLDTAYVAGSHFWQTPYVGLQGTDIIADLAKLLASRKAGILQLVERDVRAALLDADLDPSELETSVATYCAQMAALLPVQAETFPKSYPEIDKYRTAFGAKGPAWAQALVMGERAAVDEGVVGLLTVPLSIVAEGATAIITSHRFLRELDVELAASEQRLVADGDPDELLNQLRSALEEIVAAESDRGNALPEEVV